MKIVAVMIVMVITGFGFLLEAHATDYTVPIMKCLDPCPATFNKKCLAAGGVIESYPHGPALLLNVCFQKAPDAGKACALDSECLSRICNLEYAIKSNACNLVEKKYIDKRNDYYTATYSCKSGRPGICAPTPSNISGYGLGYEEVFTMKDKTLLKTRRSGPMI